MEEGDFFSNDRITDVNDTGESGLEANLESMPGRPGIACSFDDGPMKLHPHHESRPLTVFKDGLILLETFHPFFQEAEDFCITIAEPVARPEGLQEYQITTFSMYSAVSSGLTVDEIAGTLRMLSQNEVDKQLLKWIRQYAANLGKVKYLWSKNVSSVTRGGAGAGDLPTAASASAATPGADATIGSQAAQMNYVFQREIGASRHHYLESTDYDALAELEQILQEKGLVTEALPPRIEGDEGDDEDTARARKRRRQMQNQQERYDALHGVDDEQDVDMLPDEREQDEDLRQLDAVDARLFADAIGEVGGLGGGPSSNRSAIKPPPVYFIRVDGNRGEEVKKTAFDNRFPLLEEYDYVLDRRSPDLSIAIRPSTQIREYQEIALSKMFTTPQRARSGIIVLPCGAGKTCVGITAAATIRKRTLVLTSTAMAVSQWQQQFLQFTNIAKEDIFMFTAEHKSAIKDADEACVVISTYSMIGFSGRRGQDTRYIMNQIRAVEWGLLVCDEVQVMPAKTFRQVALNVRSRCKLGLTATLVREDDLITDLQWLIGPKLYEANWFQLQDMGYLARVQCVEVWCEMSPSFYEEYLQKIVTRGQHATARLLFTCNPIKLCIAEFLIRFHEKRGDKVLVFSDNTELLKTFAEAMKRYYIYGEVPNREREVILRKFKEDPAVSTIFLSKVGDNAIDLPSANVVIQINAHFSSRRQEAQRLGRILRPKKIPGAGGATSSSSAKMNRNSVTASSSAARSSKFGAGAATTSSPATAAPNAYFYSLVSKDTQEMYYASKRQQYLVEQGYAYKIVDTLYEDAIAHQPDQNFIYKGEAAEQKLLRHVLAKYQHLTDEGDIFVDEGDLLTAGRGAANVKMEQDQDLGGLDATMSGAQWFEEETGLGRRPRIVEEEIDIGALTGANAGTFVDD
eukprot:g2364.t1